MSDNELASDDEGSIDEADINVAPLITEIELSKKETYYYKMIDKYYKTLDLNNVKLMIDIITKKTHVSLRLLDWFITKYSCWNKIKLITNNNNPIDKIFNIHISYKAQLKSYKKKYFDPFRRKRRVRFKYYFDKEKQIPLCTTIGQLNFFKWMFTNNIMLYVMNNYDMLSKAMTMYNKTEKSKTKTESKSKSASTNSNKTSTKSSASLCVSFD